MITTTHIVTNLFATRRWPTPFASSKLFVVGGFAPDVGLTLMTAGATIILPRTRDMTVQEALEYSFDELFYTSNAWIAAANVLHSPVVVGALLMAGTVSHRPWAKKLQSFAAGAAVHIAMDIPVHVDDGPVLFWPLNWSYRFESPVSYWDPEHYGNIVGPIDMAITVLGGTYLLIDYIRKRNR